jgi:hypothetical protein
MRKRTVSKKNRTPKETVPTYPYIMTLDDGSRRVVARVPSDSEGPDRTVVYELGPIDWVATAMCNPSIVERVAAVAERIAESIQKLGMKPPQRNGGKTP